MTGTMLGHGMGWEGFGLFVFVFYRQEGTARTDFLNLEDAPRSNHGCLKNSLDSWVLVSCLFSGLWKQNGSDLFS